MKKPKIILASTSPRRKELLSMMGLEFEVMPSHYKEDMSLRMSPKSLVKVFAEGKAMDVAKRLKSGIVIGADTIVEVGGNSLGKPKDYKAAFDMLRKISGKTVKVYSGLAIIDLRRGKKVVACEESSAKMHKMSDKEIRGYIKTGEPMDRAGSFAIQGLGSIFVARINGCYFNIVGLPVHCLYKNLKKFGISMFEFEKWKNRTGTFE